MIVYGKTLDCRKVCHVFDLNSWLINCGRPDSRGVEGFNPDKRYAASSGFKLDTQIRCFHFDMGPCQVTTVFICESLILNCVYLEWESHLATVQSMFLNTTPGHLILLHLQHCILKNHVSPALRLAQELFNVLAVI